MSRRASRLRLKRKSLLLAVALLALAFAAPATANAAVDRSTPRVAIVRSAIAEGAPYGHHYFRVDKVTTWLKTEFGTDNVTVIGDAQLADVTQLRKYDVVVLIRQIAMTKGQRTAVRSYAAGGGGVVAVFGAGRWDYSSARSTKYIKAVTIYGSVAKEWGEVSEVWGATFYNDPITKSGHKIIGGYATAHQVLKMTYADLSRSTRLDMSPNREEANEFVTMPRGAPLTTLATYSNAICTGTPYNASGWAAAWANQYRQGRAVYFGFQVTDVAGIMTQADDSSNKQALSLFLNSVRWAGNRITIGTSTTSAPIGSTFTLSGSLSPTGTVVGKTMHADVKKPGSLRWSYSSNRVIYAGAGETALWQYKYFLKSGMTRGTYYFRAVYEGAAGEVQRISGIIGIKVW